MRQQNSFTLLALAFCLLIAAIFNSRSSKTEEVTETQTEDLETESQTITEIPEIEVTIELSSIGAVTEPVEEPTVEPMEEIEFYDVPLSEELQLHLFAECEKHSIAPAIVIAMIERESDFREWVIGDNGTSYGLMQIKPKYQQERMKRLGCNDLLDPFQNITVGVDILAEYIEENSDLYWVLMRYNGGKSYADKRIKSGNYSNYAIEVAERAEELEEEAEQ